MRIIKIIGCFALAIGFAACSGHTGPVVAPVSQAAGAALVPSKHQLVIFSDTNHQVLATVDLGQMGLDYAIAPNGNIYVPLHDNPTRSSAIAVFNKQTGQLKKLPATLTALTLIHVLADGTAFIRSGNSTNGQDQLVMVLDTNTDTVLGQISLPGSIDRIASFSDTQAIVPVSSTKGFGGNVYLIDRKMGTAKPLFPFDLEPFAPQQVIMKESVAYFLYSGFPPVATRRADLAPHVSDQRLLDAHLDVWDLSSLKLQQRIFLPLPSAQTMVLGPTGTIYIGHVGMSDQGQSSRISTVDTQTGKVDTLETVRNPATVQIRGDRLYVASGQVPEIDLFHLPDLQRISTVHLAARGSLAPVTTK